MVVSLLCSWAVLLAAAFSLMYFSGREPIVDANKPGGVSAVAVVAYAVGGLAGAGAGAGFTASTGFWSWSTTRLRLLAWRSSRSV